MDGLPWVVVYGSIFWKALMLVIAALSLAIVRAHRARSARRRADEVAARRTAGAALLEPRAGVLRGKLIQGSASTLVQSRTLTDHRTDELWLDHRGDRVELLGDLRIDHGARVWTSWLRAPRETPEPLAKRAQQRTPSMLRNVREGDEVIVAGTLGRDDGGDTRDRESAATWTLSSIEWVTAVRPAAKPLPLGLWRWAAAAIGAALACYGALYFVGHKATKRFDRYTLEPRSAAIPAWSAESIASAMPGSRDEALDHIGRGLWQARTEEELQRALDLGELLGTCPVGTLARVFRLEQALEAARRCGTASQVATILAALGRYGEADAAALEDPVVSMRLAIAAGRWRDAARDAERIAVAMRDDARRWHHAAEVVRDVPRLQCLAALFRVWAGDSAELERLQERAADAACSVLGALGLPVADQAAALAGVTSIEDESLAQLVNALRVATGATPDERRIDNFTSLRWPYSMRHSTWLAPFALAVRPSGSPRIYADLAMLASLRGDFATARRELARATLERSEVYSREVEISLLDGAAFPPPPAAAVHELIEDAVALRRGELRDRTGLYGITEDCRAIAKRAIRAALGGDAALLASVLRTCERTWKFMRPHNWRGIPLHLLAVLPRVTKHREDLAAVLRLFRDDSISNLSNPLELVQEIALYRDIARLVGDSEEAAAMQELFDRHAAVLGDRQKLIALLFSDKFTCRGSAWRVSRSCG